MNSNRLFMTCRRQTIICNFYSDISQEVVTRSFLRQFILNKETFLFCYLQRELLSASCPSLTDLSKSTENPSVAMLQNSG